MMNLETALPSQPFEHRSHCRVLDLGDFPDVLNLGINDAMPMIEKRREIATGDVAIFVDRSRENRAAVLPEPGGIVCAAAEERYSERCSSYDHLRNRAAPHLPPEAWRLSAPRLAPSPRCAATYAVTGSSSNLRFKPILVICFTCDCTSSPNRRRTKSR